MNKFILNTFDKKNQYNFIKMTIFIEKYKIKAKKNQIIIPEAAKIIIESNNKIYSFVVLSPIIEVDNDGNANCWTSSSFKEATYKEAYYETPQEKKNIKRNIKLLTAKAQLGLTANEIIEFSELKSTKTIVELIDNKSNTMIGGGF